MSLLSAPIVTIFAVEFLEGSIVIGQYRTVLLRSSEWSGERQAEGLKCITRSATFAALGAILVCAAIAVPLGFLQKELDPRVGDIIEGCSKIVASFFILMLSLKIPGWLGVYYRNSEKKLGITLREIRFNVSWNIWREVAECGIFLIPFILGSGAQAIPISAIVGSIVGLVMGGLIYVGNKKLREKKWLALFMCLLLVFLSAGLITNGVHEFEEVFGETKALWEVQNPFLSSKRLPMILLKPFGYSSKRTLLQCVTFWCWLLVAAALHFWKYRRSIAAQLQQALEESDANEASLKSDESLKNSTKISDGSQNITDNDNADAA